MSVSLLAACAGRSKPEIASETQAVDPTKLMVSTDCQVWKEDAGALDYGQGFIKRADKRIFVDAEKQFFTILSSDQSSDQDALFVDSSESGFLYIANASMINALPRHKVSNARSKTSSSSSLSGLVNSSQATMEETTKSTQWLLLFLQDRTKLIAPIRGQVCAKFPEARFADCELGTFECGLNPVAERSEVDESQLGADAEAFDESAAKSAGLCLKELGLLSEGKLGPLKKACEHFRSSNFEERLRTVQDKAALCGPVSSASAQRLPSLKRIEDGCLELEAALPELEKLR